MAAASTPGEWIGLIIGPLCVSLCAGNFFYVVLARNRGQNHIKVSLPSQREELGVVKEGLFQLRHASEVDGI